MAHRKSTTTTAEAAKATTPSSSRIRSRSSGASALIRSFGTRPARSVTTIRVAVNPPEGEATFHSVVVWNRTAEVVCEYLRKGRRVEVVGRPQERSYKAADGTDREVTEIVAFRVNFLSAQGSDPTPGRGRRDDQRRHDRR